MNKQETKSFIERQTRIWMPQKSFVVTQTNERILLAALLERGIKVECSLFSEETTFYLLEGKKYSMFLAFYAPLNSFGEFDLEFGFPNNEDHVRSLQNYWLPNFRRGCWLSGFDLIDATEHEKAKWIQGLTDEELGAWNLKF